MPAQRPSWWRRWAGLPIVAALLFATSVVAAAPQPAQACRPAHATSVLQAVVVQSSPALGQRPDHQAVDRGGQGHAALDLTALAGLSEWAGLGTAAWWHLRRDSAGHRTQASWKVTQVRGPPGRRAADASS